MDIEDEKLGGEIASELLELVPYYRRIGQVQDFQLMMNLYAQLFMNLKPITQIGVELVKQDQPAAERDWAKLAYQLFQKMEKLEGYAKEKNETDTYFRFLSVFASPFQYLRPIVEQKVNAYHDAERKKKHGTAKKFRRIQTDPNVVIEHCADCPGGGQQSQTNLKGPRTFKANKANKVKTREQRVQEERHRLLDTKEI